MKKIFSTILALTMIAVLAVAVSAAMFTDVDSYAKFEMTGEPVYAMDEEFAEYWTGNWDSMGENGDEVTVELVDGVGYNGTKGISVSSAGTSNVGLYLYATAENGIAKDYTGAQYLRVWMDLTNVSFRKANFGVVDSMFCLFSTDEVDGAWECPFYYSADGVNWTDMMHGGDGCLGDAQDSDVFGLKGWFAFPTKDFTIRSNANWEAYDELTPCNVADVQAVYLFWDYSDNAIDNQGQAFILDNIEFVADYKAFDYELAAAAPAFGVQEASGSFDGEVADNLFDGDENTKWCFDSTAFTEPYVIWNVENPINVTGYEIVTANDNADYAGRNPGAWTLSGSADGENWTVIADVAADTVLQDVNFTPFTFAADAAGEYSWFKYEIGNVVGGGVCQISGLNLLTGDVTPSAAPAVEEAEVAEEAPAEEAPAEEAEVAEEAAPAEETVEEAAQTFDFAVIGAIAAIVSAAGYAVAKKH